MPTDLDADFSNRIKVKQSLATRRRHDFFVFVAVPWPTQFEQTIIQGLMRADTAINVEVLNAMGVPAVQLGNVIEVGTGFVGIDEACTGVRSLQATLTVSLFLGDYTSSPRCTVCCL